MTLRANTRRVFCGSVPIGGGALIPIQSMTNTFTEDVEATASQVCALAEAGADIVRLAAPTEKAARALPDIRARVEAAGMAVPLVADIHFDYKIALMAIKAGADKIRINPGNIGGQERVKAVVDSAGAAGIPIRIGVNAGSLEAGLRSLYEEKPAAALAESALGNIELVRGLGFDDIVVSIKSSDVVVNTEAHMLLAAATDLPLHIGLTEAGYGEAAIIRSAAGIGALLALGIGDTLRVSLTGDPVREVKAARDILRSVNLLPGGITLISCPTCGRCRIDLAKLCDELSIALAEAERERIKAIKGISTGRRYEIGMKADTHAAKQADKRADILADSQAADTHAAIQSDDTKAAIPAPVTVALMGCMVNGPGEASHADIGVACGPDGGIYFEKGVKGDFIPADKIVETLIAALPRL